MKQFSANFQRLFILLALLAFSATAADAQDLRTRSGEDDGPRPEEGNISGSQEDISDMLQFAAPEMSSMNEGGETSNEGESQEGNLSYGTLRGIDLKDLDIETFPNPATDFLVIQFSGSIDVRVSLIDILGRTVYEFQGTVNRQHRIDVTTQRPGIYFVNIETGQDRLTRKVKVNH